MMVVFLGDWVARIPMAALVAVMIMVSIGTFSWISLARMRTNPKSSSVVMVATVVVVVLTHNLALGVLTGVLLSALFFARRVGHFLRIASRLSPDGLHRTYDVVGQVFFTSAEAFVEAFDFREALHRVTIDLTRAHFWDITAVSSLDKVVIKFRREGAAVDLVGLNEASATMVDRFAEHDKPGAIDAVMAHG